MIDADFRLDLESFHLDGEMKAGGMIHLMGENGSGKTTFLRALAGFHEVEEGHIIVNGRNVEGLEPRYRRIVYANQNSYFPHITVQKHLTWAASPEHVEKVDEFREAFGINFNGRVSELSMGQKMRVTLATAFMNMPEAILLDEVVSNISNPAEMARTIGDLSRRYSIDVILVAHSLADVGADHSYSMENGAMKEVL